MMNKLNLPLLLLALSDNSFAVGSKSTNLIRGSSSVDAKHDTVHVPDTPKAKDTEEDMDPEEVSLAAEELDLTFDEAELLLQQQQEFSKIVDMLEEDVDFLHAEMPLVPDGKYTIMYKGGNIPSHRLDEIEKFKAKHEKASVEHVVSKRSLKEAEDRVGRLMEKLKEGGYAQATFSIHGDAVKVVAKLSDEKHGDTAEGGRVLKSRAAEIFSLSSDHDDLEGLEMFVVKHDEGDIIENYSADGTFGGEYLLNGSSWPTHCTSGFVVERTTDGKRGVATAGHCIRRGAMCSTTGSWSDPFHYDPDSKNYDAYCDTFHIGEWGDMLWLTTPQVLDNPEFYVSSTQKKSVTSVAQTMVAGQMVCGYSRVNDIKKCKPITSGQVNFFDAGTYETKDGTDRFWYSGAGRLVSVCGNIFSGGDFMGQGDSGSPWWRENKAYGITTGVIQTAESKCLLFTKAKLFDEGLGVTVLKA